MLLAVALIVTRDPWLWPFDSHSIWNMPVGAQARYAPCPLPKPGFVGVDHERFFRLKASDPARDIREPSSWGKRWPGGKTLGSMPVPDDFLIPDAMPPSTPNECAAFLMPDGHTLVQLEPACRVERGGPIVGYPRRGEDLSARASSAPTGVPACRRWAAPCAEVNSPATRLFTTPSSSISGANGSSTRVSTPNS